MTRMRIGWIAAAIPVMLVLTGARPKQPVLDLLRAEGNRISSGVSSLNRGKDAEGAPAVASDRYAGGDPCRAPAGTRDIRVSSARELGRALAQAKPGDHIRMADGVYRGTFVLSRSGTKDQPITLCGTRAAILEVGTIQTGYAFHLRGASHCNLVGFTVRKARKGIMADRASYNDLRGLEVHTIGDEGIHLRAFSHHNRVRDSWVHDVGLDTPFYGEAVYLGSARSNWGTYTRGRPDASDFNQVTDNVLGPNVTAEGVDAKEGTRGGVIAGNLFHGSGATAADSWVDLKGSDYRVERNRGTYDPKRPWRGPVEVNRSSGGWGERNVVGEHHAVPLGVREGRPYRYVKEGARAVSLLLPRRTLPYTLPELAACFPQSVEKLGPGLVLLHEHVLGGPGSRVDIRRDHVREVRLRSTPRGYATLIGVQNDIRILGSNEGRVLIRSWDPATNAPDLASRDGRAFVTTVVGRMDWDLVEATDMGYGTGWASGAAWKGRPGERAKGNVSRSRFERNFFGAYTFECDSMRWTDNIFANNDIYGFDPHDNSDYFLVTGNQAFGNTRHGIIFSRGCRGNVLRGNASFSNGGHGIMFDDGKVVNDGNPRHRYPMRPEVNVMEDNEVWGNDVGIALQGAMDHVIRGNRIRDNRFGIRLDGSDRTRISNNTILRSKEFAVHLLDGSDDNRITDNRVQGGEGGIVTHESRHNIIEDNTFTGIIGQGVRLEGRTGHTSVNRNQIFGRGSKAIDLTRARSAEVLRPKGNAMQGWMFPREPLPALVLWSTILGVPFLSSLVVRRRRVPRRRRIPTGTATLLLLLSVAGAGHAEQTISLTARMSAVQDDNIFKYSDSQLRDIENGTTPFRYGITDASDMVIAPSLALQWQQELADARRRALRVRVDGAFYGANAAANFGEVEGTWREYFDSIRRLTFAYGYTPDRFLRRLYDADLTAVPQEERYRDAHYDAHSALAAWRHEIPFMTSLEWAYRFDRRIHESNFRERDSDFHVVQAALGWEGLEHDGSVHFKAGHTWRLARAEDGDPGLEGDLSYHGPEVGFDGRVGFGTLPLGWLFGDAAYSVERKVHDSDRPSDTANFGRTDIVQVLELGLGLEAAPRWLARAFYRRGWSRANIPTASLDTEIGDYDQNQFGVTLEWTNVLQRRP
jgi:parallel beta-helix repeat protein